MAVKLSSNLPPRLKDQISAHIEVKGSEFESVIRMLPYEEGQCFYFEGAFLPPEPGTYHYNIILSVGGQRFVVERGERDILAPLSNERWTRGPLVIKIIENLFLGNAAAAADPQSLEDHMKAGEEGGLHVAVLNASAEREPRPALLSVETKGRTKFAYRRFRFQDVSLNPMDKEEIWGAVRWIHEQMKLGPVFVHCHAGIGRSASLIAAYLRLCRYPDRCYDQIIEMINEVVRKEGHHITPHIKLPETLKELQEDEGLRRELAAMLEKESYDYLEEPAGEVKSISFAGGYEAGQTRTVQLGEKIVIQARVEYTGMIPCGVIGYTNLSGEKKEVPMARAGTDIYQAEVTATRAGSGYWFTVGATPRRHDHYTLRKWLGGFVHFTVIERRGAGGEVRDVGGH